MSLKRFSLEFVFEEHLDGEDVHLELAAIDFGDTNIHRDVLSGIAEGWAQSDSYWIKTTQKILDVIDTQIGADID